MDWRGGPSQTAPWGSTPGAIPSTDDWLKQRFSNLFSFSSFPSSGFAAGGGFSAGSFFSGISGGR